MERGLFGFVSVGDFLTSLFGLSSIKINTVFAILTAISAFISNYMWDTPQALYVLWLLMLCDFITGVIKSVKNKNFSSWRMPRMLVQLVATTILLAFAFNIAKHSIFFAIIPSILIGGFYGTYIVSLMENMSEIGWLNPSITSLIKKRFGIKALEKRVINNDNEPTN